MGQQKNPEKVQKTFKKPIDNALKVWYNRRVAPRETEAAAGNRSLTTEQQEKKYKQKASAKSQIYLNKRSF